MILQAFIRGAIVIAIAALIATLLRNRSAALRHHVWATAVVVQLALLAFIPVLPKLTLPIIPTIQVKTDAPVTVTNTNTVTDDKAGKESLSPSLSTSPVKPGPGPQPSTETKTLQDYLLLAWIIGAGIIFARYLLGTLLMLRVTLKGERVEDGDWLVLAQRTARELGITRPVTMVWGEKVSVPITWGVLYPMILLPKSAQEWPLERRRFVLVHEMAHVKRFDAFTQLLAQVTAAIFWFSPFVWLAEWRMRIEREHACDDTVIQHGTEPTLYAGELLQMVRSLVRRRAPQPAFAALAMARKSEFEGRMLAILDPERPRRVSGMTSGLMFALLSVLIAAPLAAVDPFAVRVVTTPSTETPSTATPSTATAKQDTPAPRPPMRSFALGEACDFNAEGIGTRADVTADNALQISLRRSARCVQGDISGPVQLSPDEQRILAVKTGGFVQLRELTPQRDVKLVIDHSSEGGVWRSFTINDRIPDDDGRSEREWVARVLPELLSEGSIRPQERVQRMLQSNGLAGTLRQIAALASPSARLAHFKALVAVGEWTAPELNRIKNAAAQALNARDLENFNSSLPKSTTKVDSPRIATNDVEVMEQILMGINSSYDLHMAMKSQLTRADKPMLMMFARVAQHINSGYELATFLIEAKPYYLARNDLQLEDAWFNAAAKVGSSYERSRLLIGILDHATSSERVTLKLLRATTNMSSSVDKATLLAAVAKAKVINTQATRTEFLKQVNTITTSTDRRMVLEALQ
jgi:beta-lactamase regulating signal transducer with metallopeptidase domain